jgi:drug/metabolite transporter (DMT)-like permease
MIDYLPLIFQQLIASSTHLIAKNAVTNVDPFVAVLWRAVFSCFMFALWLLWKRRSFIRIERNDIWRIVVLGFINIPLNQLAFFKGLSYTTPANTALLYALTPTFVFMLAAFTKHEKPTARRFFGIAIAFVGVLLVLFEKGLSFDAEHITGNLLVLSASFSWAVFTTYGRPLVLKYGALNMTAMAMFAGLVTYLPFYVFIPVSTQFTDISLMSWGSIAYLGWITSGLGYTLWYMALSKIPASKVAVFNNIQPVLTTILTMIIFGIMPTTVFLIGGAIILAGVLLTQRS